MKQAIQFGIAKVEGHRPEPGTIAKQRTGNPDTFMAAGRLGELA